MAIDEPDGVASRIVHVVERGSKEVYFGGAEPFFVKLNGVLPRLVDVFLANNDRTASALFAPQDSQAKEPHREQ
jgi:hypothetical protein